MGSNPPHAHRHGKKSKARKTLTSAFVPCIAESIRQRKQRVMKMRGKREERRRGRWQSMQEAADTQVSLVFLFFNFYFS